MALHRYTTIRGLGREHLPQGIRQDTRKHTRHVLRPDTDDVVRYFADPTDAGWEQFAKSWRTCVEQRFADDPAP